MRAAAVFLERYVDVDRLMNTITSAESGGIVAFASLQGNEASFESSV